MYFAPTNIVSILLLLFGLGACGVLPSPPETAASPAPTTQFLPIILSTATPSATETVEMTPTIAPTPEPIPPVYGRTYHQANGNRFVEGRGDLAALEPLDIVLSGRPEWVVSAPFGDGVLWVTVLEDGTVQAFEVKENVNVNVSVNVPVGHPPLLVIEEGVVRLLVVEGMSAVTHPVPLENGFAYVNTDGNLVINQRGTETVLPVNALPDTRIMTDDHGRLLLLTQPDESYPHNVLGDAVEAKSVTLIETDPEPRVVREIVMEADWVIEGVAPLWVDWDGDGAREIIVTRTRAGDGAQIVVYSEDGTLLAQGEAIGRSRRWRHQLAIAPFGLDGEMMLVDVLTPHIGGQVEFYSWNDDELTIETGLSGYTSHVIGTRNLDMAVAGDWVGSGGAQLLLPSQDRMMLGVVGITDGDGAADVLLDVPVGGQVVTNLSTVSHSDGLAVGVGRADNTLRIWQP